MTEAQFILLAVRYKHQQLTTDELGLFLDAAKDPRFEGLLGDQLADDLRSSVVFDIGDSQQQRQVWRSIVAMKAQTPFSTGATHRIRLLKTAWFRYAAILLLIAGTATFVYIHQPQKQTALITIPEKPADILPGGNKAILTLADGSRIILDSAANGSVAQQGSTQIMKLDAGAVAYHTGPVANTGEALYNTISTPKGGQYQIVLPDGSKVWLNATSSIRFPTVFVKDRTVDITGEIYFEVTKNNTKPFIVHTPKEVVRVLGTSFNINAYADETAVKTSLLEGTVQIDNYILKPGEAYRDGAVTATDIEQDIAWKNGEFQFGDKANIQTIMRQVSRWYNVDVEYRGTVNKHFWGSVSKNVTLSQVLTVLEKTGGVHFKVDGNKIIVMP